MRAPRWLFAPSDGPSALWPRWVWLRLLGVIFLSAFLALYFQVDGLNGPRGILPAQELLDAAREQLPGWRRFHYIPSLYWLSATSSALKGSALLGMLASALLVMNLSPRALCLVCTALFMAFVSAARDFSSYQSDGMLLEAGLLSAFLAPPGLRPGLGAAHPAPRAARFLLLWEWFRIYFCSGLVKLLSGDPQWSSLTAMEHYYENGPLPTWLGWYAQQMLPLWFHHASAAAVLVVELGMPWVMFLSRRLRLIAFALLTPFQIGIILTANYAFLNYIVLSLGVLLLEDDVRLAARGWRLMATRRPQAASRKPQAFCSRPPPSPGSSSPPFRRSSSASSARCPTRCSGPPNPSPPSAWPTATGSSR